MMKLEMRCLRIGRILQNMENQEEWQKFDPNNPKAMHYGQRIEFKTPEKLSLYKSLEKVYLEEGKNF